MVVFANRIVVSLTIEYLNNRSIWAQCNPGHHLCYPSSDFLATLCWTFLRTYKSIQLALTPASLAALVILVRVVA